MFARLARLPLRRCIHTASTTSRPWRTTAKAVFGASAATITYMAWRMTNERNHLALDTTNQMTQGSTKSLSPSLPLDSSSTSETESPVRSHVEDGFIPDPEQPDAQNDSPEETTSGGGGAFNPQTGEINWDCPCLGGMAHGPCGPEFREAFSCFVFSEVEPKGIECVERFKAMQNCFRAHPEVYADEIMDDDEDEEPINTEKPEGLPPVTDSSEELTNDTAISETTSETKPRFQRAGSRDR